MHRVLPYLIALFVNLFLISFEFGFSSNNASGFPLVSEPSLFAISNPERTPSTRTITPSVVLFRLDLLSASCLNHQLPHDYYLTDGFVRRLNSEEIPKGSIETVCGDDSRVENESFNKIMFNITTVERQAETLRYAEARLEVIEKSQETVGWGGGEVDVDVQGTVAMSMEQGNWDKTYEVHGSCTGFRQTGSVNDDPMVYCYLSDGGDFRFVMPGTMETRYEEIQAGDEMRLVDVGMMFWIRLLRWDATWKERDIERRGAIRFLSLKFRPRPSERGAKYEMEVAKAVGINLMWGAEQLESRNMEMVNYQAETTERAEVATWVVWMVGIVLLAMGILTGMTSWMIRDERRKMNGENWIVPVKYNDMANALSVALGEEKGKGYVLRALEEEKAYFDEEQA